MAVLQRCFCFQRFRWWTPWREDWRTSLSSNFLWRGDFEDGEREKKFACSTKIWIELIIYKIVEILDIRILKINWWNHRFSIRFVISHLRNVELPISGTSRRKRGSRMLGAGVKFCAPPTYISVILSNKSALAPTFSLTRCQITFIDSGPRIKARLRVYSFAWTNISPKSSPPPNLWFIDREKLAVEFESNRGKRKYLTKFKAENSMVILLYRFGSRTNQSKSNFSKVSASKKVLNRVGRVIPFSAFIFVSFFFSPLPSLSFNILRFIIIIDKYCCSTIFLRYLLTITLMLMKFMMAFTVCKHTDENLWWWR